VVQKEGIEKGFEKLWVAKGGDKDKIASVWEPKVVMVIPEEIGMEEPVLEREVPASKIIFPRPCNRQKQEFVNWIKLLSQGCRVSNLRRIKLVTTGLNRGIPHRKLIMPQQLSVNVYPGREFLARGRQETQIKSCQHG